MEFLVIIAALGLLGLLANRYGVDSRDRVPSHQEHASAQGVTWGARRRAYPEGSDF